MKPNLFRELTAAILCAGMLLQSATAVAPEWWSTRQVLTPGAAADDFAVANVGQLKHMAKKAALEMDSRLPGGAGAEISALIASWETPPDAGVARDDYAAVNLGQLKAVSKLFYDRLVAVGALAPGSAPWSGMNPDDHALANVGQLKTVFAFDIPLLDTNGNGIPDTWEMQMFGNLDQDPDGDFDLDGLTNREEFLAGTSAALFDSDGDGWDDWEELAYGGDPKSATKTPSAAAVLAAGYAYYDIDSLQANDRWYVSENLDVADPQIRWFAAQDWYYLGESGSDSGHHTLRPATPLRPMPDSARDSDEHWHRDPPFWNYNLYYDANRLGPQDYVPGGAYLPIANRWDESESTGVSNSQELGWGVNWKRYRMRLHAPLSEDAEKTYLKVTYEWDKENAEWVPYDIWDIYSNGYWKYPEPTVHSAETVKMTIRKGETVGDWLYVTPATENNKLLSVRLLPVEVKVVNRDDPSKTWTTGTVTSGPLAYTSPTISEVSDVKNGDLISWSVSGLTGGSFQWWATGPSGSRKDAPTGTGNEWKLEDPLDWLPGKWRIHCRYTPSGGAATEFDFEQNLGYRSPDITVIGWIDGPQIVLPSGVDKPLLRTWPGGTTPDWFSVETWMGSLSTRLTFLGQVAAGDVYTIPITPDPVRKYLNAWLIKDTPNDAPPASFLEGWNGYPGRFMVDEDELTDFRNDSTKFRSFHRFQARFELDDSGKIKGSPHFIKSDTNVGATPTDWLGWFPPDPRGETGPHDREINTTGVAIQFNPKNGKTHSAKLADDFEQYTQGRIAWEGAFLSKRLNNLNVPWIWSIIEFGAAHAKAGTTAVPEHEIFPVYHVYYNGKRLDTLTNSISEAKLEEFIQLGAPIAP